MSVDQSMYDHVRYLNEDGQDMFDEGHTPTQLLDIYEDDTFDSGKERLLHAMEVSLDLSPKGSIDRPILDLVEFLNYRTNDYVTTSSCSGRISVYKEHKTIKNVKSKGIAWLLVEHGFVSLEQVKESIEQGEAVYEADRHKLAVDGHINARPNDKGGDSSNGNHVDDKTNHHTVNRKPKSKVETSTSLVMLKVEAFIIHIRCRTLDSARWLYNLSRECGYRESGIHVSGKHKNKSKVMLAIRTTSFLLETPIASMTTTTSTSSKDGQPNRSHSNTKMLVDDDTLSLLIREANCRLHSNFSRIDRLLMAIKNQFQYPTLRFIGHNNSPDDGNAGGGSDPVYPTTTLSSGAPDNRDGIQYLEGDSLDVSSSVVQEELARLRSKDLDRRLREPLIRRQGHVSIYIPQHGVLVMGGEGLRCTHLSKNVSTFHNEGESAMKDDQGAVGDSTNNDGKGDKPDKTEPPSTTTRRALPTIFMDTEPTSLRDTPYVVPPSLQPTPAPAPGDYIRKAFGGGLKPKQQKQKEKEKEKHKLEWSQSTSERFCEILGEGIDDSVHAAAIPTVWHAAPTWLAPHIPPLSSTPTRSELDEYFSDCLTLTILSGGRRSTRSPLPCLRCYRVRLLNTRHLLVSRALYNHKGAQKEHRKGHLSFPEGNEYHTDPSHDGNEGATYDETGVDMEKANMPPLRLETVECVEKGDVPNPRWGHSLTSLGTVNDSEVGPKYHAFTTALEHAAYTQHCAWRAEQKRIYVSKKSQKKQRMVAAGKEVEKGQKDYDEYEDDEDILLEMHREGNYDEKKYAGYNPYVSDLQSFGRRPRRKDRGISFQRHCKLFVFLYGGRDSYRVYNDAYIGYLELLILTPAYTPRHLRRYSLQAHWTRVAFPYSLTPCPRFYHSAAPLVVPNQHNGSEYTTIYVPGVPLWTSDGEGVVHEGSTYASLAKDEQNVTTDLLHGYHASNPGGDGDENFVSTKKNATTNSAGDNSSSSDIPYSLDEERFCVLIQGGLCSLATQPMLPALDGRPVDYPRDSPDYNPSISTSRSIATHLAEERQARRAKWTTLLDEAQQRGDTEMITKFTLYLQESDEMEQQEQDIAQHVAKVRKEAGKSAVYVPSGANTLESSDGDGGEEGEEERDGGYDSSDTIVVDLAAYFATPEAYKYVTGQHSAYRPPLPPPAPVVVKGSDERDSAVPHPGPLPPTKHTDRYENESLPGMHLQGDSEGTMGRECIPLTATWDIVMIDVNSNDDYIKQHLPTIEKEGWFDVQDLSKDPTAKEVWKIADDSQPGNVAPDERQAPGAVSGMKEFIHEQVIDLPEEHPIYHRYAHSIQSVGVKAFIITGGAHTVLDTRTLKYDFVACNKSRHLSYEFGLNEGNVTRKELERIDYMLESKLHEDSGKYNGSPFAVLDIYYRDDGGEEEREDLHACAYPGRVLPATTMNEAGGGMGNVDDDDSTHSEGEVLLRAYRGRKRRLYGRYRPLAVELGPPIHPGGYRPRAPAYTHRSEADSIPDWMRGLFFDPSTAYMAPSGSGAETAGTVKPISGSASREGGNRGVNDGTQGLEGLEQEAKSKVLQQEQEKEGMSDSGITGAPPPSAKVYRELQIYLNDDDLVEYIYPHLDSQQHLQSVTGVLPLSEIDTHSGNHALTCTSCRHHTTTLCVPLYVQRSKFTNIKKGYMFYMLGGGSRVLSFAPHYCSSFKAIVDTNDHDITSTRPRSDRVPLNGGGYGILPDKGGTKDGNTGTTNAATGNKYGGGNSKAARKRAAKATREAQAKQSSPMVDPTTTGEAGYARDLQSVTYGNYTAREVSISPRKRDIIIDPNRDHTYSALAPLPTTYNRGGNEIHKGSTSAIHDAKGGNKAGTHIPPLFLVVNAMAAKVVKTWVEKYGYFYKHAYTPPAQKGHSQDGKGDSTRSPLTFKVRPVVSAPELSLIQTIMSNTISTNASTVIDMQRGEKASISAAHDAIVYKMNSAKANERGEGGAHDGDKPSNRSDNIHSNPDMNSTGSTDNFEALVYLGVNREEREGIRKVDSVEHDELDKGYAKREEKRRQLAAKEKEKEHQDGKGSVKTKTDLGVALPTPPKEVKYMFIPVHRTLKAHLEDPDVSLLPQTQRQELFARLYTPFAVLFKDASLEGGAASSDQDIALSSAHKSSRQRRISREAQATAYLKSIATSPTYRDAFRYGDTSLPTAASPQNGSCPPPVDRHGVPVVVTATGVPHRASYNHGLTMMERATSTVIKGALPHKYEMVGDILFLPELALMKFGWQSVLNQCENDDTPITTSSTKEVINDDDKNEAVKQIWKGLLELYTPATRIARRSRVDEGPMRESRVEVLYPLSRSEWDALRPVGAVEKAAKLLQGTTEEGDLDYNDMERGMIGWDFSSSHVYASSLPPSSINSVDGTPGSTVERDNEENKYNTAIHQDHRTLVSPAVYDRVLMTFAKSIGWTCVKENGISFHFDITKTMFCSGNNTERMRMSTFRPGFNRVTAGSTGRLTPVSTGTISTIPTEGDVVVDLYCGIGYYTLPFLVHAKVGHVHALEWNPYSMAFLRYNLMANKVDPTRYSIYHADNQQTVNTTHSHILTGVADRVCCGLLPSSRPGWALAVQCLKSSGGVIHVHENVIDTEVEKWCSYDLPAEISLLLRNSAIVPASDNMKQKLIVECIHISRVKSYAPHVIHVVADLVLRQAKAGEKSREQREGMGVVMAVGVGTSELGLDM